MAELQAGSLIIQAEVGEAEVIKDPILLTAGSMSVQVEIAEPPAIQKDPFVFGAFSFMLQVEIAEPDILTSFWHVQFI